MQVKQLFKDLAKNKSDILNLENSKANKEHNHNNNYYTKDEVDNSINSIDTTDTYISDVPSTVTVGGIDKGFTTEGMSMQDVIYKLLHQYVPPRITISADKNAGTFEKGTSVSNVLFTANGFKEADNITNIKIYKDSAVVQEKTHNTSDNVSLTYTEATINSNVTYKATVTDNKNTVTSNTLTYSFVYPAYVGHLDASISNPNSNQIKTMNKKIQSPGNISHSYTIDNKRMCIACPPGWEIRQILDPNSFDVTNSFTKKTVSVNCADSTNQNYSVYISEPTSQTNFAVKFNR